MVPPCFHIIASIYTIKLSQFFRDGLPSHPGLKEGCLVRFENNHLEATEKYFPDHGNKWWCTPVLQYNENVCFGQGVCEYLPMGIYHTVRVETVKTA